MKLALMVGGLLLLASVPAIASTGDPCTDPYTGRDGIEVNGNCRTISQPGEPCTGPNGDPGVTGPLDGRCFPLAGVQPCEDGSGNPGVEVDLVLHRSCTTADGLLTSLLHIVVCIVNPDASGC